MVKKLLFSAAFIFSISAFAQTFIMSNTPINSCTGTHQDPGGSGNYADNLTFTQTICSNAGDCVSLTFTSFGLENGFDFLEIHNGPSTSSPMVPGSPFTGTTSPGTITSYTGCLTLIFSSDISVGDIGWTATITCGACPPPPPPPPPYGWTQRASVPASGRHRAVAITIGNRGYAGLGHINAVTDILYDDWWEYDPGTNTWTQKANFPPGPRMHAAAFAIGNYGYVGTGRDNSFTEKNDLYKYDPSTNSWTLLAPMPTVARRGAVAFAVNGKGYIGTGDYSTDFWEYDPVANSWIQLVDFSGSARRYMSCFALGSRGYGVFGTSGTNYNDLWEYGNYDGVSENEQKNITVKTFPNPFNENATISFDGTFDGKDVSLEIYDLTGKKIIVINSVKENKIIIKKNEMTEGMYFVRVLSSGTVLGTQKLIVN